MKLGLTVNNDQDKKYDETSSAAKRRAAALKSQPATQPSFQMPSFQRLVSAPEEPANWYKGDIPTVSEIGARIYTISQSNPSEASGLWETFQQLRSDSSSPWFNPYERATNKAVDELSALGFDMSKGVSQQWLDEYSWLKNYYRFGTGNTPLAPSSKSSKEQDAAYWYYQLEKEEGTSQKAENEWNALQEEIRYWAGRTDRNYTDDQILSKIDWKNYPTLAKMDASKSSGLPIALNRGIGYSQDALEGVIWAARNGSTGDPLADSVQAVLGHGKGWEENRAVSARLDPKSDSFNPYAVGSTEPLDAAARYFGELRFDQNWLDAHRDYAFSEDATKRKNYQDVYEAEQFTQKAEQELSDLRGWVDEMLKYNSDPDYIMDGLLDDYKTLQKMDDSLKSGKLMATTRAIDYRKQDIEKYVRDQCAKLNTAKHGQEFTNDVTSALGGAASGTPTDSAISDSGDNRINAAGPTIMRYGTDEEKAVWQKAFTTNFDSGLVSIQQAIKDGTLTGQQGYDTVHAFVNDYAAKNYPGIVSTVREYQDKQAEIAALQAQYDTDKQKNEQLLAQIGGSDPMNVMGEMNRSLDGLRRSLENAKTELENMQPGYEKAVKDNAVIRKMYAQASQLAEMNGADPGTSGGLLNVIDYASAIGAEYKPTDWGSADIYDALLSNGMSYAEVAAGAKQGRAAMQAALDRIDYALKTMASSGIDLGKDAMNNLHRERERLKREINGADYFLLQEKKDFQAVVEKAKEEIGPGRFVPAEARPSLISPNAYLGWTNSVTDSEYETYLYLRETEGEDAAKAYYDYLMNDQYGIVNKRETEYMQNWWRSVVDASPGGAAAATLYSVLTSPLQLQGAYYSVKSLLTGEEINPYNQAFRAGNDIQAIRSQTKQEINEALGEDTFLGKAANLFYDAATSAGDSTLNALLFGGASFGSEAAKTAIGKFGLKAAESLVSAAPMGFQAAGNAIQDAKLRGATNGQAMLMGTATFFAETITEAVTYDNIRDAVKAGSGEEAKGFFKTILGSMMEEAPGEMVSELVGTWSDDAIMGELSKRQERIDELVAGGMDPDEAAKQASREIFKDVLYAGLTGALSGGLSSGAGYVAGTVRRGSRKSNLPPVNTRSAAAREVQLTGEVTRAVAALNQSLTADESSQTQAIGAALAVGDDMNATSTASATAQHMSLKFGSVEAVQLTGDILLQGERSKADMDELKTAVTVATLGEGAAATVLDGIEESGNVTADDVNSLIDAAQSDMQAPDVQARVKNIVLENQVSAQMAQLVSDGGMDAVAPYEQAVSQAKDKRRIAAANLTNARQALEGMVQKINDLYGKLMQNAGDTNLSAQLNRALNEMKGQQKVVGEYEQSLENTQSAVTLAENNLNKIQDSTLKGLRQQAQQNVQAAQEVYLEEQQAKAKEAEAQAQIAAEQKAAQQVSENIGAMNAADFIENNLQGYDVTEDERKLVEEKFRKAQIDRARMADSMQNNQTLARQLAKKFGIAIEFADTTNGGTVTRQNGYYSRRSNKIVLDQNATVGDALFFVMGHELTHVAEQSGTYGDMASALLRMQYGPGVGSFNDFVRMVESGELKTRAAADVLARQEFYNNRLASMHEQDSSIDATPLSVTDAAQEVVADIMGKVLRGDQTLIKRLAAEEPSVARRIIDSIKSFLKKLTGVEGEWKSDAQRVVDMLETALKDAQRENATGPKYSLLPDILLTDEDYQRNRRDVVSMTPVKAIAGDEFSMDTGTLKKDVLDFYQTTYGGKVEVPLIGTVSLDNKGLSNSLGHGMTPVKAAAYAAVPDVLKNGKIIQYDKSWKGNARDTIAIAAPIEIGEGESKKNYLMGVIVNRPHFSAAQRYYTHDAIGLAIKEIGQPSSSPVDAQAKGGGMESGYPTIQSLLQELIKVNENFSGGDNSTGASDYTSAPNSIQDQQSAKPVVKNSQGEEIVSELPGGTITRDVSNSLSSWTDAEKEAVRKNLIKRGFAEEDINKWIDDINSVAAVIADNADRLDFIPDETQRFKKPNGDVYKWTLDASTLCAKRLLYQGTFNEIQKQLPNTALMPEDLIDLTNMMREMGYQTPCGICYVESVRRHSGEFTREFIENYKGDYKPSFADLTTSDGLSRMQKEHPEVYDAYIKANNARGSGSTKPVQLRTDYRGDVRSLNGKSIEYLKSIGGLRIQSFSDFETPHLMDMMQAVLDMSAVSLTAQAYTKVPNFAWVFGDTGIKINLSLMGDGTGVDADGNLIFSSVEGMDFEEAMKLRNRYSQSVGTILVGMNDAHILAAMADDRIDFIIPFHKSGWSQNELNKMSSLANYQDYQPWQNERVIVGKNADGTAKYKNVGSNLEPVGPNGYWDFSKSGKENAEIYLQLCKEKGIVPKFNQFLVDNGDGSFSLQPDGSTDGYWKTLIDFKMYDNNGVGAPQQAVTPNINMVEAMRVLDEYEGGANTLPVAQPVVERYVEEYKEKHPRTKYSLPAQQYEQEYQEAVASGNTDWQAMVVDKAAYASGYTVGAYHGSPVDDITSFNTRSEEGKKQKMQLLFGTHFTQNKAYADLYAKKAKNSKGTSRMALNRFGKVYDVKLDLGKSLDLRTARNYTEGDEMYQLYKDLPANIQKKIPAHTFTAYETELGMGSGKYVTASMIERALEMMSPKDATEFLVNHKYNSVLYDANYSTGMANNRMTRDPSIIMLDPERIKSADPVTYDDDGNVIPLSRRFDQRKNDIRYSLPSEDVLDAMIQNYLDNGGYLSTNTAPASRRGSAQRQFGRQTAQQGDALHDEVKDYLYTHSDYTPDTNRAQIDRAMNWVRDHATENDAEGYFGAVEEVTSPDFNYMSADGQARMLTLMGMAALKGDVATELRLADAYNRQGTDVGRTLQARKMFRMMTPLGRVSVLQQEVNRINQRYIEDGRETRVALSQDTLNDAANATTEEAFTAVQKKAWNELAKQMPPTWKERLRAWRMLSMLGNPRTHVRNVLGNAIFMPAVRLKNMIGTGLESAMQSKIESAGEMRTKSLTASSANKQFARQDAATMKDILTGEGKYNPDTKVERERDMFGTKDGLISKTAGKALQALSDFNSWALEAEDWVFLQKHYTTALAGWMQANNLTPDDMQRNPELLQTGRAYAISEAQKATYRDANETATMFSNLSRKGGFWGFVVDAALPFKKTPANILKRGIEYSPVGLVSTLFTMRKSMAQYQAWRNGLLDSRPKKALSPTQVIDKLAAGLSGTAIMALGAALAAMGVVTVSLDDDEDEFEKLQGKQKYALNVNLFGEDVSYTIDWAAPVSMPFFVGASIYEAIDGQDGNIDAGAIADSILQITEPVFNLSMLDGVNSLLSVNSFGEGTAITQIGEKLAANYMSSFVPTALGQVSRTIDPVRRKNYVESGASLSTWRYALEQVQNKTPFSVYNIPYRNAWGEEDRSIEWLAALENFISPGYISKVEQSELDQELQRLFEATNAKSVIPKEAGKTISMNGETIKLTDKEYDAYAKVRGETAKAVLTGLTNTPQWMIIDDDGKVDLVEDAWKYANQTAQAQIADGKKMDKWIAGASTPAAAVNAIIERHEEKMKDAYVTDYRENLKRSITDGDVESAQTCVQALIKSGKDKANIRSTLTTHFKPLYKEAIQNGDMETANSIMYMLMMANVGYSKATIKNWIKEK